MICPPEIVFQSPYGYFGPYVRMHRAGVVQGRPLKVCVGILSGNRLQQSWWNVCNEHGALRTFNLAIESYDPFQRRHDEST